MTTRRKVLMEIDLSETRAGAWTLGVLALLVALEVLGALGRTLTPHDGRVLTWSEWQVLKEERLYRRELGQLQQAVDALAAFYEAGEKDPIRGQYVASQVRRMLKDQQVAVLESRRQAVLQAANAVEKWSLGVLSDADVRTALERAARAAK